MDTRQAIEELRFVLGNVKEQKTYLEKISNYYKSSQGTKQKMVAQINTCEDLEKSLTLRIERLQKELSEMSK